MGANVVSDKSGATFRCLARRAKNVWVVGSFNGWTADDASLLNRRGDFWVGFIAGAKAGDRYKLRVEGELSPPIGWKRDPYARELTKAPPHPRSDCIVHDPTSYPWHDGNDVPPYFHDLVVYQLHVGTFNGPNRETRVAKFLDVLGKLDYLVALGVNALLFLPIAEFSSERGLGYEGADIFSPEQDYCVDTAEAPNYLPLVNSLRSRAGLPQVDAAFLTVQSHQLKVLIELCHLRGLAVLFDVVYNHIGMQVTEQPESLWNFEEARMQRDSDSYFFSDQDWAGPCFDIDWKEPCRQFLIDNGSFFLREYHVDGLRYDEVSALVETNQGYGWRFCQNITGTLRAQNPRAIQIAEYWRPGPDPWIVSTEWGHAGFDACYHDGLRYAIRDAMRAASGGMGTTVEMDRIARFLWPPCFNDAWRSLPHIENHDLVREGRDQRIPSLAAPGQTRSWWAQSRSRVASGLLLTAPGIPLLFMGQEFYEDKPWHDDARYYPGNLLWWEGLDTGKDRAMVNFHRFMEELIWLRRNQPALRGDRLNVFHCRNDNRVLAFHRWLELDGHDVVVVASLNDYTFAEYELPWPAGGWWREIFNSEAYDDYTPAGNYGGITAWWAARDGMPATARLVLPANSLLVFAR
jgi:1,4-alpha-glucan branching enzyme